MFVRFLRHTRKQPAHVRERYALGIAGSVTGVIALIWSLSLPSSPEESARRLAEQEESARPFASLAKGVGEQFSSVRDAFRALEAYEDEAAIAGAAKSPTSTTQSLERSGSEAGQLELTPETIAAARERAARSTTSLATPEPTTSPNMSAPQGVVAAAATTSATSAQVTGSAQAATSVSAGVNVATPPTPRRSVLIATTSAATDKRD